MNFLKKKLRFDIIHFIVILIILLNFIKYAHSAECRYYTDLVEGTYTNITCSDVCCPGYPTSKEAACCFRSRWNKGAFIALSLPILCCIAGAFGGFFYCCLVVKPKTKFFSDRNRLPDIRNRSVSPDELSLPAISNKEKPPTYIELYSKEMSSSENNHDQIAQTSSFSHDFLKINNENTS